MSAGHYYNSSPSLSGAKSGVKKYESHSICLRAESSLRAVSSKAAAVSLFIPSTRSCTKVRTKELLALHEMSECRKAPVKQLVRSPVAVRKTMRLCAGMMMNEMSDATGSRKMKEDAKRISSS